MHFPNFAQNDKLKNHIAELFASNRVPHAILLEGPTGSGKRVLARIIAAGLICSGEDKPCGICQNCKKSLGSGHPDIEEVEGGQGPRTFPVDAVRRIRLNSYIAPNEAECKVYILINAHTMSEQAQNALLKILEEPPAHSVFILTAEARSMLLPTVLSRLSTFTLNDVENHFSAATLILPDFINKLCASNEFDFMNISAKLEKDKELFLGFCRLLVLVFRDSLGSIKGGQASLSGSPHEAKLLSSRVTARQAIQLIEASTKSIRLIESYANQTLVIAWTFSRYWQIICSDE
jgi:DNA polymerase-3 subunit delta'